MIYPFRKIVFDCKNATLRSIKKAEGRISFMDQVKLSYHLFYCEPCRRFVRQWQLLDRKRMDKGAAPVSNSSFLLSDQAKERIQGEINRSAS
jgi:hypothetical protein